MATATRMTANSKAALQAADRIEILAFEHRGEVFYQVKAWVGDRVAFVTGGDGFVMQYPTIGAAERAVKRVRSDLRISCDFCELSGAPAPDPAPAPAPALPRLHFEVTRGSEVLGIYRATDGQGARDLAAVDLGYASEDDMIYQRGLPSGLWARFVPNLPDYSSHYDDDIPY